jgi:Tol biopolymer transport system component
VFNRGFSILCTLAVGSGLMSGSLVSEADATSSARATASHKTVTNGRIVYTKRWRVDGADGTDIFSVRPDGKGGRRLTSSRAADNPKWSPNGSRIAFDQGGAVWVMKADGSGQEEVTSGDLVGWMPTGGRVLVVRWADTAGVDPTFLLHTVATGEEDELPIDLPLVAGPLEPPYDDYDEWDGVGDPVLAPDGEHLALMLYRTDYGDDGYDWNFSSIFTVRLDGTDLTRVPKYTYAWSISDWSPNSQQLLRWGEEPRADCVSSVRSIHLDGNSGSVSISTRCPQPGAAWSPDGRKIVFTSGGTGSLKIARKNGTHVVDVIPQRTGVYRSQPDWRAGH